MKLFLDDVRNPIDCVTYMHTRIGALNPIYLEEWVVVRTAEEFEEAVWRYDKYLTHVSLDHDLAPEHYEEAASSQWTWFREKTGYDCAKFLVYHFEGVDRELPMIFIHSYNPAGTANIKAFLGDRVTGRYPRV